MQLARFAVEMQERAAQLRKVEEERDEYRKLVMLLKEQVERLRRGLLGQKAERLPRNDAQLSLTILGLGLAGTGSAEAEAAAAAQDRPELPPAASVPEPPDPAPPEPKAPSETVPGEVGKSPGRLEIRGAARAGCWRKHGRSR